MARFVAPRRSLALLVLAQLAVAAPAVAQTPSELLARVPGASQVVLLAPSLDGLSATLATLNTSLALDNPMMADLRATLGLFGVGPGLRGDAALATVFTDVSALFATQSEGVVFLLPVTDYGEFLAAFGGVPSGGVDLVTPATGPPLHVRPLGDYALAGLGPLSVSAFDEAPTSSLAGQVGGLHEAVLTSADAVMLVNMSALEPLLTLGLDGMFAMMDAYGGMSGSLDTMMAGYHAFLASGVRDAALVSVAFDVRPDGVSFNMGASFEPGSTWASVFGPGAPVGDLLAGLPSHPAVFVGAGNLQGFDLAPLLAHFETSAASGGVSSLFFESFAMLEGARTFTSGWYASTEPGFDVVTIYETDGANLRTHMERSITGLNGQDLMEIPASDGSLYTISYATTWEAGVATRDDLTIDRFSTTMLIPPALAADPMMGMNLDPLGTANTTGLLATNDSLAITLLGYGEDELEAVLRTWRARDGLAATLPALTALRAAALRPDYSSEAYLDLGALFGRLGFPMAVAGVEPMAFFGWTDSAQFAGQMLVPNGVVTAIRTWVEAFESMGPI